MKIFIGTVNIASQLDDWKVGFEKNGCYVVTGSYGNHSAIVSGGQDLSITKKHNIKLPLIKSYTLNKRFNSILDTVFGDNRKYILKNLIKEFDVFLFIWNSILDNYEDFKIITDAGKRIVVQHVGDDVRWQHSMKQDFLNRNIQPIEYDNYDLSPSALKQKISFLRKTEKFADFIYSAPNQAHLALKEYGVNAQLLNIQTIKATHLKQRRRPRVLHLPSTIYGKGTKYVYEAINQLKREGIEFEFFCPTIKENNFQKVNYVPHNEAFNLYRDCDIFIGQLLTPGGGKQERELLALSKVVLSSLNREYETHIPKECPIIDVNPDNLAEKLKEIILDYDKRSALAKLGRPYVEQFHDPVKITARILEELTTGEYKCPTYQPTFFREEFIPESPEHLEVYNKWTEFVKNEDWYRQTVPSGERAGLIF